MKSPAIYRRIQEQKFPSPVRPGRWDAAEVEEWIMQNKASRPNNAWKPLVVSGAILPAAATVISPSGQNFEPKMSSESLQAKLRDCAQKPVQYTNNLAGTNYQAGHSPCRLQRVHQRVCLMLNTRSLVLLQESVGDEHRRDKKDH